MKSNKRIITKYGFISLFLLILITINFGIIYPCYGSDSTSDEIVIAHSEYAWTFDPMFAPWGDIARMARTCYDPLVSYNPETKQVIPWVAKDWKLSKDKRTYTFYLNEGIKFHDGTELTASDVLFSIKRLKALGKSVAHIFNGVKTTKIDKYTLKLTLEKPNVEFLNSLVLFYIINENGVKAHEKNGDWAKGYLKSHDLGSGPYKVINHVPQQKTVCKKFADYWKGWKGDHIDKITWLWIGESSTQRMMLEQNELDISMKPIAISDLPKLKSDPQIKVYADTSSILSKVDFRVIHEPLDKVKVRKALAMAIDYDYYIEATTGGYGSRANSPLTSSVQFNNDELKPTPYNLEKAKKLLAEAGYPNGDFKLTVVYESEQSQKRRLLEILERGWGKLGIEIEPMGVSWNTQAQLQQDKESKPDVYLGYIWPETFAPFHILDVFYNKPGTYYQDGAYWKSQKVDALISKGFREQDPKKRKSLAKKAQRLIVEAQPSAWIAEEPQIIAARKKVKGYEYNPAYHDTLNIYDMYIEH